MELLQIIGTLGAIGAILWLQLRAKKPVTSYRSNGDSTVFSKPQLSKEERREIADLTDPHFGPPVHEAFCWHQAEFRDGTIVHRSREYRAPCNLLKSGYVMTFFDEFPIEAQKRVFLWLERHLSVIPQWLPEKLSETSEVNHPYNLATRSEVLRAFSPEGIIDITLTGTCPVKWLIRYDSAFEQDVYGGIEGEDETVKVATFWM